MWRAGDIRAERVGGRGGSATRGGGDATGHRRGSAETESRVKRTAVSSTRRGTRRSVAIAAVSLIRAGTRLGGCRRASPRRPPGDPTPKERGKSRGDAPSRLSRDFARTLPVGRAARAHVPVARRRLARPRWIAKSPQSVTFADRGRSPRRKIRPFPWIFLNQVACGALRCTRYLLVRFFMTTFTYWNTYFDIANARRCFDDRETSLGFFCFLHNSVTIIVLFRYSPYELRTFRQATPSR